VGSSRHVTRRSGHGSELMLERLRDFVRLSSSMRELTSHDRDGDGQYVKGGGR
jgi:hypothetical protein